MTTATTYAADLLALKAEIDSLKAVIALAVEQFKCAIKSLTVHPPPASSGMETNDETTSEITNPHRSLIFPNLNNLLLHHRKWFMAMFL